MIIAIANHEGGGAKSAVANCLALLRARSGRKVLLVEADPKRDASTWCCRRAADAAPRVPVCGTTGRNLPEQLERLRRHYNDIVIDTDGRNSAESRSALIAARLVVVPVSPNQVDLASQYKLIARLNSARMFNPGLRVLFVACGGQGDLSAEEAAAIRAYAARVMSASLAGIVLHEDRMDEEMKSLYDEVFAR